MTTFYDSQGRRYTLTYISRCYTHLHSLSDNATVVIANQYFSTIFSDTRPMPRRSGWPL